MLRIITTGSFALVRDGEACKLPASRKTRALLAYLALSPGPHSRQSLCELLWEVPDDPRAALRWSLSKLRPFLNEDGAERLIADRDTVALQPGSLAVDLHDLAALAHEKHLTPAAVEALWLGTDRVPLEDCELPSQRRYMAWVEEQRNELARCRVALARRLAQDETLDPQERDRWAERWLREAPFDAEAAQAAVGLRQACGRRDEAAGLARRLRDRFRVAHLPVPEFDAAQAEPDTELGADAPPQSIRFLQTQDSVTLAWASVGPEEQPPLVKAANWLSHLELDWEAPIWSPLFRELAQTFRLIRYDERGCGLSDWDIDEIGFESFVADLELVVDEAGIDRFPLLGISQGAAVSIEFAARHPERVSYLVLFGGYDCGWRHIASEAETREREAIMVLTETGWGRDNPSYRHMFSQTFMPGATAQELAWFDEFQRRTTSPRNAVRFLEAFSRLDVRDRLADVRCPTLVVHSRGDQRIPFETGRKLAAAIPGAQLAGIDSDNHLLLGREAASAEFVRLVRDFVAG